jgi:dihydrofolate synthase/folylpolyglutamate synthase
MHEFLRVAGLDHAVGGEGGAEFIHVTGTNGKGSVTAYIQSILVEQGYRTGAFFSPFVYDPRERIQFGRDYISEEDLALLTAELMPFGEGLAETEFGGATEFEFKAALGFRYWQMKQCEWVALEVGLGGRLDATNVVKPKACVIVSIGLDHVNILGETIEEIAAEKAGIIKPGVPVIVGELPPAAMAVIERVADFNGSPIKRFGKEITFSWEDDSYMVGSDCGLLDMLKPGLAGVMQPENMALAIAACGAAGAIRDVSAVATGVANARLPARFERRFVQGSEVILDGAHNSEAASVLRQNLEEFYPGRKVVLLTTMVAGHEPRLFYGPLADLVEHAFIVPIEFHRALKPTEVQAAMEELGIAATSCGSVREGVAAALASGGLVLVTGSFYLIGEVGNDPAFVVS